MEIRRVEFTSDGVQVCGYALDEHGNRTATLFEGGSLKDGTEALENLVLLGMYCNGVGYFTPDKKIGPMVTNLDLRSKMEKIIAEQR